ncbi:hypothetical protein AB1Y20_006347 [Prymnesium parvum]|uniref:cGMP-dependent protein kinase n=1 Tax=Prymnesium parvum TaxID=97485 RepID=A0AB34J4F9_PRYPA
MRSARAALSRLATRPPPPRARPYTRLPPRAPPAPRPRASWTRCLAPAAAFASLCVAAPSEAKARSFPRVEEDYELDTACVLGEGAFGVVYKGRCRKTGKEVAIKRLSRKTTDDAAVRQEVAVLRRVGMHRSVASLEAFYETPDFFYLVMEFVSGGELFEHLIDVGAYSEAKAASILKEVASGVALLHAQGMCHADIKPENLLLTSRDDEAHVKLVDFGLSCAPREVAKRKPGTWAYWPPEAFLGMSVGLSTDMWALGVLTYIMLSGYHPFDPFGDADDRLIQQRICRGKYDFNDPCWRQVSDDAKQLIQDLLQPDPANRLTVEQLLQHPWLRRGGASDKALIQADERLRGFRKHTAQLRAAVFAAIIQQRPELMHRKAEQTRSDSPRSAMLETDVLANAFRGDMRRVMGMMGRGEVEEGEVSEWLKDAAQADREGSRVMYGDFVDLMSYTNKASYKANDDIFKEGDPADGFHVVLSGRADVLVGGKVVNQLEPGDCFGETALLSDAPRGATIRCREPVVTLRLSRDDFETGFLSAAGEMGVKEAHLKQSLGFIQMVSRMERQSLRKGEAVFNEGDADADKFYIVESGVVRVWNSAGIRAVLGAGECFGEKGVLTGEPRSATVTCASDVCNVVYIHRDAFMKLMQRSSALHDEMKRVASTRSSSSLDQIDDEDDKVLQKSRNR